MATNKEWVGEAVSRVLVRKRPFQYIGPYHKTFNIDIRNYASQFGINVRAENLEADPVMGCVYVKPLMINRNNFMFGTLEPDTELFSLGPKNYINEYTGSNRESQNEIKKRVFRCYPNEFQRYGEISETLQRGDYVDIDQQEEQSDDYQGPIFGITLKEPIFDDSGSTESGQTSQDEDGEETEVEATRVPLVSWIEQKKAHGNVEWFLMQEYGNFMNQSFWIDLSKDAKLEPNGNTGVLDTKRYEVYGADRKIHAYFGVRIGWDNAKESLDSIADENSTPIRLLGVKNSVTSQIGPYDIIFPIDGKPFIFDHQGDETEEDNENINLEGKGEEVEDVWKYNDGYIAAEAPDDSWILKDNEKDVRFKFYYLRGKLIMRASYTETPWVFPANISPAATEETKTRYENFSIPPSRVCIMGRGFSFRMSYNPLEFNIAGEEEDLEKERGYHGKLTFMPIPERTRFPNGARGGWSDYFQADLGVQTVSSGREETHNFTLLPDDRYRDPTGSPGLQVLEYKYGFDIVTDPYYGQAVSTAGQVTSMMIAVDNTNILAPKDGNLDGRKPRDLCNAYMRPPSITESAALIDTNDENYGWDVSIKDAIDIFEPKYPVVEFCCRPPTVGPFTEEISRRFASPVFWSMMGIHVMPEPDDVEWTDISNFVSNLSYDMTAPDFLTLRQNFNVQIIIPKDYEFGNYSNNDNDNAPTYTQGAKRQELLDLFYNGVLEVEIWMGWLFGDTVDPVLETPSAFSVFKESDFVDVDVNGHEGKVCRMFSGIAQAGPLTQAYDLDTVTLNCVDKLAILEDQMIINSPIYDGMAVDRAFLNVGQLLGLPESMFDVRSATARWEVLPTGFTFSEPRVKFQKNTNLLDASKQIAGYFMHTIRTDPDGKIVMGDIYYDAEDVAAGDYYGAGKKIDDLSISHSSYNFFVEGRVDPTSGETVPNAFQRVYEQFTYDKHIADQLNQLLIMTIDRNDGALIMDNRAFDLPSVENANSKNFIGYLKAGRYQEAALGDEEHLRKFREMYAKRVFTAPMYISFTTYGRPSLRPLDIIGVYHSQNLNLAEIIDQPSVNYLKYRITSVRGTLDWKDGLYQYRVDVEAEHL